MPRSRNTRIRPKDTSRIDARRRYREEHRAEGVEPEAPSTDTATAAASAPVNRSAFALPDVVADIKALPTVFRKPLVWAPFGMLLLAFVLALAIVSDGLPAGTVADLSGLYVSLTLPPTSLFVFFIGGFVADRASYLVGAILGLVDAVLITLLYIMAPAVATNQQLQQAGLVGPQAGGTAPGIAELAPLWGIAIFVGIFAAGFAAWYKRFLRSSQERARANRAQREQEQAERAKAQARADKQAAREARRAR